MYYWNSVHQGLQKHHSLSNCRFVPLSQSFPLHPAGHWHSPVTWWQVAPWTHWHLSSQPTPNRPGSHAEQSNVRINDDTEQIPAVQSADGPTTNSPYVNHRCFTFLTVVSDPAATAAAPTAQSVTLAAVLTCTLLLAVSPKPSRCTLCINTQQKRTSEKSCERKQTWRENTHKSGTCSVKVLLGFATYYFPPNNL